MLSISKCALHTTLITMLIKTELKAVGHETPQCDKCGRWVSPHVTVWTVTTSDCFPVSYSSNWLWLCCVVFCEKVGCLHSCSKWAIINFCTVVCLSGVVTNILDNSLAYEVAMKLQKPMRLNIWPLISLTSNLSFQRSGLIIVTGAKLVHEVL